ncbi:MAG: Rieske 2Fe-2S domain-containing protein [Actinomycetota bacterium]|nr:Rieske 2Fe-2S domain-containing protein [Actinomycetota bacterium]
MCTHQGCTVVYQNAQLLCPCHGSVFDPSRGGAVLYGPLPVAADTDKGAEWEDLSHLRLDTFILGGTQRALRFFIAA